MDFERGASMSCLIDFIQTHLHDDPQRLLLSAQRYPGIDVRFAVQQIEARQRVKDKLPCWCANPNLIFPSSLACQQASSEETARYKQRFLKGGETVFDCTGGLGVDSAAFAGKAAKVVYMERDEALCRAARHNFTELRLPNIELRQGACTHLLPFLPDADLIYIDPARRGAHQERVFALSDCEPDIVAIQDLLLQKAPRVLVKASPMADIRQSLQLLPHTTEVHVVSVRNDCKELLFLLERGQHKPVEIHCIHFPASEDPQNFTFTLDEESEANAPIAAGMPAGYLYEPNASLLKAGAFKLPALRFGLHKLHRHTHLYQAPEVNKTFPGRIFRIEEVLDFHKQTIKTLHLTIPQANIAVRNFCMEAHELRKRLHIKDGGDIYIFGVSLNDQSYALIVARKI